MARERKLTLAQAIVGGYFGCGLFVALFCFLTGANLLVWLVVTTLLTFVYTAYYFITTKPAPQRSTGSNE